MGLEEIFSTYGWWIAGMLLLIGEVLIPGIFLLWLGLAALAMGVITWLFPLLPWYWALALYAVIAAALVFGLRPMITRDLEQETENPNLNRRLHSMIGRTGRITDAVVDGHGRARIGDTEWRVQGEDMAVGTHVRVVGVDDKALTLKVVALANEDGDG